MRTLRLGTVVLLAAMAVGCSGIDHVDTLPGGGEMKFDGIRDALDRHPELHVLQTHGMGDHPTEDFCAAHSRNLKLQDEIARRLGLQPQTAAKPTTRSIPIDGFAAGSYSTRVFVDDLQSPGKRLYFSCMTWGESGRLVKKKLLELDGDFKETNEHEGRRAVVNGAAKRFVNRSFSDPVIYVGQFGPYIRRTVRKGMGLIGQAQGANREALSRRYPALASASPPRDRDFLASTPMVVITDSLGSRVLFDVLWPSETTTAARDAALAGPADGEASETSLADARKNVHAIYMLANQLPLLALAQLQPPPPGTPLDQALDGPQCLLPKRDVAALVASDSKPGLTVVAFTDPNDALSYRLSDDFKQRCAPPGSGLSIVNVTLSNNKWTWFGLYANLIEAHADGFKDNPDAIGYLVEGN